MRKLLIVFWLWTLHTFAITTDFDDIVVGTSPISMCEAVYRACLGHQVLVVERAAECGGAWKSITVCGIPYADLGCHEFGSDARIGPFFETYLGCEICQGEKPLSIYPTGGCYALTHNLQLLMEKMGVFLLLNSSVESVFIDTDKEMAEVKVNGRQYTTKKVVVTPCSEIRFENLHVPYHAQRIKYPHIYFLIADSTPLRFTYKPLRDQGITRAMNLTQFVGLEGSGTQLISFQVQSENHLADPERCVAELKRLKLVDEGATILCQENYIYEQSSFNQGLLRQLGPKAMEIFDVLNTAHIVNMGGYTEKWKKVMKPWNEVFSKKPESCMVKI